MLKIPVIENYLRIKLKLKFELSIQDHGKMKVVLFFARFVVFAFYLVVIFQFHEYQVHVLKFLNNMYEK